MDPDLMTPRTGAVQSAASGPDTFGKYSAKVSESGFSPSARPRKKFSIDVNTDRPVTNVLYQFVSSFRVLLISL